MKLVIRNFSWEWYKVISDGIKNSAEDLSKKKKRRHKVNYLLYSRIDSSVCKECVCCWHALKRQMYSMI